MDCCLLLSTQGDGCNPWEAMLFGAPSLQGPVHVPWTCLPGLPIRLSQLYLSHKLCCTTDGFYFPCKLLIFVYLYFSVFCFKPFSLFFMSLQFLWLSHSTSYPKSLFSLLLQFLHQCSLFLCLPFYVSLSESLTPTPSQLCFVASGKSWGGSVKFAFATSLRHSPNFFPPSLALPLP